MRDVRDCALRRMMMVLLMVLMVCFTAAPSTIMMLAEPNQSGSKPIRTRSLLCCPLGPFFLFLSADGADQPH